jgi:hypothetical protein
MPFYAMLKTQENTLSPMTGIFIDTLHMTTKIRALPYLIELPKQRRGLGTFVHMEITEGHNPISFAFDISPDPRSSIDTRTLSASRWVQLIEAFEFDSDTTMKKARRTSRGGTTVITAEAHLVIFFKEVTKGE